MTLAERRAKLWRAAIPEQAPVASDVDWEALGKGYQLAGGSIKQAVVRAATQAALRIEVDLSLPFVIIDCCCFVGVSLVPVMLWCYCFRTSRGCSARHAQG